MGGAFVCLTLFSSLVIAFLLGIGTRVRESAVTLLAGRWLSLSVTAFFVAFSLALFPAPCLAYGDELEPTEVIATIDSFDDLSGIDAREGVEVLGDGEELPDDAQEETFDVRRIDDGMLFAVKGNDGTVVVKSVASPDPISSAARVVWDQLSKAYSRSQLVYAIENDLAWRWYHADSDKRAKVPLVPSNDSLYTPLNNLTFTGAGSAQEQYDTWYSYNHQFWPLTLPYNLRTINGGSWSPSSGASITDFQNYAEWYNWFEGISSSGGGQIVPTENSITLVLKKYKSSSISSINYYSYSSFDTETLSYTATDEINRYSFSYKAGTSGNYSYVFPPENAMLYYSEAVKTWLSTQSNNNKKVFVYINNGEMNVYTCTDYQVTYEEQTQNDITYNNPVSVTFSNDARRWTYSTSSNGQTQSKSSAGVYNGGIVYRWNTAPTGSGSAQSTTLSLYQGWVSGAIQGGGGVEPTDPVFPNYPQPQTPQQPIVTVNSPTYNTYTTNEITTTTADLTPILNAIRILNDNTVNGFENLTESLDVYFDNLHRMLEAWLANLSNWLELIYEELQQVNRYLEAIYFNTGDINDSPIYPDLDNGNTIEQQTAVNLELLKRKFPTSIPWDLYGILALLEAPPLAPEFTLPVVMTDYTITIDLDDFSPMAAVSRRMSVLLFAVGLLMNTKKLASIDIGANHGN